MTQTNICGATKSAPKKIQEPAPSFMRPKRYELLLAVAEAGPPLVVKSPNPAGVTDAMNEILIAVFPVCCEHRFDFLRLWGQGHREVIWANDPELSHDARDSRQSETHSAN